MRYLGGGIGHRVLAGIIDLLCNLKFLMGKDWDGKIGGRQIVDMDGEYVHGEQFGDDEGEDDEEDEEQSEPDVYDEENIDMNMLEDEENERGDLDGYDPAEASGEESGEDEDDDDENEWQEHLMPGLRGAGRD